MIFPERLQNAAAKPINRYTLTGDNDVCNLASALICGVAKAHAFEQGNKRTAFTAGLLFIDYNGFGHFGKIESETGMKLGLMVIDMCNNSASEERVSEFLRETFIYKMTYKISN